MDFSSISTKLQLGYAQGLFHIFYLDVKMAKLIKKAQDMYAIKTTSFQDGIPTKIYSLLILHRF